MSNQKFTLWESQGVYNDSVLSCQMGIDMCGDWVAYEELEEAVAKTKDALEGIRDQMEVNLGYLPEPHKTTLEILQGHIEDQLKSIEKALGITNG